MTDESLHAVILDPACGFFGVEAMTTLRSAILDRLPDVTVDIARTPAESQTAIEPADVVLTHTVPDTLLDRADDLRWIQALSAGLDSYDIDDLDRRGIVLTSSSGVHAQPIAEQVLGYMLLFERNILQGIRQQRRRAWEQYQGGELRGKMLGVVGAGAIGTRVAEFAHAVGMRAVGTKRSPEDDPDLFQDLYGPDELEEVLIRADYLVIACPLTEGTRQLIGQQELGSLSTSAVLINVARGEIVDESALVTALQQRRIRGAALDVFEEEPLPPDSPLWGLSNVVVTPHMGGYTPHLWERTADLFATNYERFIDDRELVNQATT